jgi:hypothetical protein
MQTLHPLQIERIKNCLAIAHPVMSDSFILNSDPLIYSESHISSYYESKELYDAIKTYGNWIIQGGIPSWIESCEHIFTFWLLVLASEDSLDPDEYTPTDTRLL